MKDTEWSEPQFGPEVKHKIILLVGLPGQDKADWVKEFKHRHPLGNWREINSDGVRLTYCARHNVSFAESHNPPHAEQIGRLFVAKLRESAALGYNLIIHSSNVTEHSRRHFLKDVERAAPAHPETEPYYDGRAAMVFLRTQAEAKKDMIEANDVRVAQGLESKLIPQATMEGFVRDLERDMPGTGNKESLMHVEYRISDAYRAQNPYIADYLEQGERGARKLMAK